MTTHVLVVDDEQDTLNLLRLFLEINGYTVSTTLKSREAMALATKDQPDVVLLDIMMSGLDGFELCKMMRNDTATANLPIIFVTAYESLDLKRRSVEVGADMILHKPVDSEMLTRSISEAITLRAPTNVM